MGHTLDELLDATGISELDGAFLEKNAAEVARADDDAELLKLAERCERAAAQPSAAPGTGEQRALAEKTAAVAIIAKTLGEIERVSAEGNGEKIASDQSREAAFIKRALASGHASEEIARFLKQAGMLQSMRGTLERGGAALGRHAPTREQVKAVGIPAATGLAGLVAGRALSRPGHHAGGKKTDGK